MKRQLSLSAAVAALSLVLVGSSAPSLAATRTSAERTHRLSYRLAAERPRDSVFLSQRRLDPPSSAEQRLQNESWSSFLKRDQQWDGVGQKDINHFGIRQNRLFERGDPGIRTDAGLHTF